MQIRFFFYESLKGYNERKVGFSLEEEEDENNVEDYDMEKKHPLKLHRR